jgi:hypothetical protein
MRQNNQVASGGVSFFGLLFLVFLALKLTGYIAWSWWWITAPLWGPTVLVILIMIVVALRVAYNVARR